MFGGVGEADLAGLYVRLALEAGERRRDAVLERLLAIAPAPVSIEDWRDDAQAQLQPAGAPRLGAAAIALQGADAVPVPVQGYLLLATPLHTQATLSSVRLPAGGVLRLSVDEARALAADHGAKLEGPGRPRLIAGRQGELLLWSDTDFQFRGADPATLLGRDLRHARRRGNGAARLLAWSSETQLWLFDHPVNRARLDAGEPPITMLWPWGAAEVQPQLPPLPVEITGQDEIFDAWKRHAPARDELLRREGLAHQPRARAQDEPTSRGGLEHRHLVPSRAQDSRLIVVGEQSTAFSNGIAAMTAALRPAVRTGGEVHLSAGCLRYSLRRLPRRWFARRERPWWEYFEHDD
ncbi:MAG: hypothetical protein JSS24_01715 [Proteobacteria bacterium]|nr:hypothetical protein [Pseudomonadota bacterium]